MGRGPLVGRGGDARPWAAGGGRWTLMGPLGTGGSGRGKGMRGGVGRWRQPLNTQTETLNPESQNFNPES